MTLVPEPAGPLLPAGGILALGLYARYRRGGAETAADSERRSRVPTYLRATEGGVLLTVRLQPRAGRSEIGAPHGDARRVRVTAPPQRGAANEALVRLLAYTLRCAPSRVEIVAGAGTARKRILLHGFTEQEVLRALEA